ncbi:hypothetical protein ACGGAI_23810 [Streptomyces antibioticus]|uniref:hypothetical protein n=1 Tax=Streptomyces antibioticus TaxID=1890 RepID=UPI00372076F0
MTYVAPNPYSPYADADPLYRHLIPVLLPSLFGEPAPGTLAATGCGRMAVVPDEPLRFVDEQDGPLPAGVCPACITAMTDGTTPPYAASDCRRCESSTRHNGLCAQCRQEQHADWWDAQGTWARPFRLALPGKRVLDGAVFPNGQAVIIDDPVQGLSSGAPTLEQLVAGYHRAEVLLAEDVVRVGTARAQHAVQMYAEAAVELEDARRDLARLDPFGDRHTHLPAGITRETCVTAKCVVCEYSFDEEEAYTAHFKDLDAAHQTLRDHDWTVLADGSAICPDDDEEHQALRTPAEDPAPPVSPDQTALDVGTEFVRQVDQPDETGLAAFETDLAKAQQRPVEPESASSRNRRAYVHNAITNALAQAEEWVPLSVRIAATRAALAEVDAWHAAPAAAEPADGTR